MPITRSIACSVCLFTLGFQEPYVTPERAAKMEAAIARRTYSVVPILESTYDMGNLAAVCRSADAFSFGAVHYVKRR